MFGHNGVINSCVFSKKGDFFATGGVDSNLMIWRSSFSEEKGESIKDKGLCQSGHRVDQRTVSQVEECMKKKSRVTPTVTGTFF
jgi:WD40 repeat protein